VLVFQTDHLEADGFSPHTVMTTTAQLAKKHRVKLGVITIETICGTRTDIENFCNARIASGQWRAIGPAEHKNNLMAKIAEEIKSAARKTVEQSPVLAVFRAHVIVTEEERKKGHVRTVNMMLKEIQLRVLKDNHEEIVATAKKNAKLRRIAERKFHRELGSKVLLSPEANRASVGGTPITRRQALKGLGNPKTWARQKRKLEAEMARPRPKKSNG
jgi:hypothetical protein